MHGNGGTAAKHCLIKTHRRLDPAPNNQLRYHFQLSGCKTVEPSIILYSSSPLAYLEYPINVNNQLAQ